MRLFGLIYKATIFKDSDATWKIIDAFQPLVRHVCKNLNTGIVDEDIVSEINLVLYRRIQKFDIFK